MKKYFMKDNVCVPYKLIMSKTNNFLTANGWLSVASADEAEVYIAGCCGAFHSLEGEALDIIREAVETKAEVVVFGCLVRISPEKIKAIPATSLH